MIKDILAHSFTKDSIHNSFSNMSGGSPCRSLVGKTGDINKNNDRLKFSLINIRFPSVYDEEKALVGHPTIFLKILHFSLFSYSPVVKSHMFLQHNVDRDIVHLNDYKFMQKALSLLVSIFNYRPKITIDQFFKYGYAESKMLLCCDVIQLVKQKSK
mmetsp:Transcript_24067/g.32795  ORF Transcript_24067/g.32795 Transcript_24067/m.32795 type:complete len:157 (+) Transcript_24067:27-497(+)